VQVGGATNWASVHAGNSYSLALRTDGTLWAWGFNSNGQLGKPISSALPLLIYPLLPPVLSTLSPASGAAGSTLAATGTDLGGATAITFTSGGGTATAAPAGYVVASGGTGITGITVPPGRALGTYTLTVTTPNGTSNGLAFTVLPAPTLTAVAPTPVGWARPSPSPAPTWAAPRH
jgi:hypothetical protein